MRFCSLSGGIGNSICAKLPLEILLRVVPDDRSSILCRISGEFKKCINQRGKTESFPGLIIATSTTVIHFCGSLGIRHALPNGSGIRATSTSSSRISVKFNNSNFWSFTNLCDLFTNFPSPISASCNKRIAPFGSWSLLSTQSPSENNPSLPIKLTIVDSFQPTGKSLTTHLIAQFNQNTADFSHCRFEFAQGFFCQGFGFG